MKKLWNKVKSFFKPKQPKPTISMKDLEKKTKAELEKLGRKLGVELDKRLTKDKLIKQIKKASK
tara:strand:+ start:105 stop:296 length:192 start_codon:yes stop_codon:yes gene_type:complete